MKSSRRSLLKDSSKSAARLLSASSRQGQDSRGEKQRRQRCSNEELDRDVFSITPTLDRTFDSMSTLESSGVAVDERRSHNDVKEAPTRTLSSAERLQEAPQEQHVSIIRYLFYVFILHYIDCLLERFVRMLKGNIHRLPSFISRLHLVKVLLLDAQQQDDNSRMFYRTQNLLNDAAAYASDHALETLSPATIVETAECTDDESDSWGHFADFQE